jgi:hypothetical protein
MNDTFCSLKMLIPIYTEKLVLFRIRGRFYIGIFQIDALVSGYVKIEVLVLEFRGSRWLCKVNIDGASVARALNLNRS